MVYFKYALRKHELYQIKKEKIGSKKQRSYSLEHRKKRFSVSGAIIEYIIFENSSPIEKTW